jgi:hypothetical protein
MSEARIEIVLWPGTAAGVRRASSMPLEVLDVAFVFLGCGARFECAEILSFSGFRVCFL